MKNLYLVSLGCPKTRVDSEVMLGLLRREGWKLTPNPEKADAIIVSTCAFLQSSIVALKFGNFYKLREAACNSFAPFARLAVFGRVINRRHFVQTVI